MHFTLTPSFKPLFISFSISLISSSHFSLSTSKIQNKKSGKNAIFHFMAFFAKSVQISRSRKNRFFWKNEKTPPAQCSFFSIFQNQRKIAIFAIFEIFFKNRDFAVFWKNGRKSQNWPKPHFFWGFVSVFEMADHL